MKYFAMWFSQGSYYEASNRKQIIEYINANNIGGDLPIVIKGRKLIPVVGKRITVERLKEGK